MIQLLKAVSSKSEDNSLREGRIANERDLTREGIAGNALSLHCHLISHPKQPVFPHAYTSFLCHIRSRLPCLVSLNPSVD